MLRGKKPLLKKLKLKVLRMAQKKKSVFGKEKIMTGSIPNKGRREINMDVHRKNILLKVPTPVFVIPWVILFVVGMLLVISIWAPLNLWKIKISKR